MTKARKTEQDLGVAAFERALKRGAARERYVLRLYVTGTTPKSVRAIENVRKICEEHLRGRYDLEVIDIYQQPKLAKGEQIIAAPTLIKKLPEPLRRLIGDMSDKERVLLGLDLRAPKGGVRRRAAKRRKEPDVEDCGGKGVCLSGACAW